MNEWISVNDRMPVVNGEYKIKGFYDAFQNHPFEEKSIYKRFTMTTGYFVTCFDWKQATHWKEA